jgi:protein translocase SEC61 complex gamma subunit
MSSSASHRTSKLQRFWLNTKRIFKISTKPTRKEFGNMIKICLIGLGVIGLLSYIFQLISQVLSDAEFWYGAQQAGQ